MKEQNQEEKIVLAIIRAYFRKERIPNIPPQMRGKIMKNIKATTMDGIAYKVLKKENLPKKFIKELKEGFDAIKTIDRYHKKVLKALKKQPCKFALIKEAHFKASSTYVLGTRYSLGVDVLFLENSKEIVDIYLGRQDFLLNDIDVFLQRDMKAERAKINKNAKAGPQLIEKQVDFFKKKQRKEELFARINRTRLFEAVNKLTYFYSKGGILDAYFEPCVPANLYKIPKNNLQVIKQGKYHTLSNEDSLVLNAGHFFKNFWKYKNKNNFQEYLKCLVDVEFLLAKKDINWQRVVILSRQTNCASNVWFYLYLAKKYLNTPVPQSTLTSLLKQGSTIQNYFLKRINPYKLLFNKKDKWAIQYSKTYLEVNLRNKLVKKIHGLFAKK